MEDPQKDEKKEVDIETTKPEQKSKVELDDILIKEIGQFGKYQLKSFLLAVLLVIFIAFSAVEYIFTTARISTRCLIPECETEPTEFSPYWLPNAVPSGSSSGSFDNCQRFGNTSAAFTVASRLVESNTCPSNLFDRNVQQPCDSYVYQNTHSVVYDVCIAQKPMVSYSRSQKSRPANVSFCAKQVFLIVPSELHSSLNELFPNYVGVGFQSPNLFEYQYFAWSDYLSTYLQSIHKPISMFDLACDEWRRSLIGTIRIFGTLTALPIIGFISDRWGRRVALTISAFNTAWIGVTRYWADTYIGFMLSEFFEATFGSGGFSCVYILMMELVGPKFRVAAGAALNTCFAVGQVITGLLAWAVPNWRNLTLVLYIPQFLTIFYYWLISESVRWYMSKGRFDESEALLRKVAKVNGKTLSEKSLEGLRHTAQEKLRISALEADKRGGEPWLIMQVFRHKPILLRCLISPIWWITTTFIYYGLSLNAVNMSGNRYLNYVAVAAVEIPGFWISYFLLDRIGRKPVLTGSFWLCAACQFAYIFIPTDMYAVSLTVYLIAKCSIAMVATAVYVYTAELYPTKNRHSLFAYSSMMGRIGSMVAPLTPAFGSEWFEELPFVLFGSFALVSGILIFFTPETLGYTLPDTFEQADQLGNKNKSTN